MTYERLPGRLDDIRERIFHSQRTRGFSHPVRIVAVTKGHGAEAVEAAIRAGIQDIGENRVQEALAKQDLVKRERATWHLIGSLQRNKVKQVGDRFDWIHSVDRADLVDELAKRLAGGRRQKILVEVNCSGEAQKGGVAIADAQALIARVVNHSQLEFAGLMTMAALSDEPEVSRIAFSRLRQLKAALEQGGVAVAELSMGMSGDFAVAVEEGATMIRLGTILFGERAK